MDASYLPAITGLIGAAIGSASSIATIVVQSRLRDKRDRAKQVIDLSLAEFGHHLELARARQGRQAILPLSSYVYNNDLVLKALDSGDFGPDTIADISAKNDAIVAAIEEVEKRRGRA